MKGKRGRRARNLQKLLEMLEPRQLMTVDFSGSITSVPAAALAGTSQNVTLNVINAGTSKYAGPLTMAFYAAPDGDVFDPNTAKLLTTVSRAAALAGSGGSQNFTVAVPISPALVAGNYRIYGVIDSANKISESDETNNVAQSAVVGIVQPNYDLVTSFGPTASLVPSVVAGVTTNASVPILVTNSAAGSVNIPAGVSVAVQVVARPIDAMGESDDVVLNRTAVNVAIGGLAHGKSKTANVAIEFPANLALDGYEIVVKVDTGNALAETNETNNEATFAHLVSVANPFSDPAITFDARTAVPANVVADNRAMPLTFDVTNEGNTTIPAGTTCSIAIAAQGISDTTLKTFNVALAGLAPGKMKQFTLTPTILSSLSNDAYTIVGTLATGAPGDLGGNDSVSGPNTMTVGPAFYNLAATAPTTLIAPAIIGGAVTSGQVNVGITNLSNTRLPAGTRAAISLVLRPVGVDDNSQDIPVGIAGEGIGGMAIGATESFRVGVTIPATLPNGDPVPLGNYNLVSIVTPPVLVETTTADNTALGAPITIGNAFTDLAITSASTAFPVPSAPGTVARGTVVLRNTGSLPVQQSITIQFIATPTDNVNDGFFIGSSPFTVNLQPGQSSTPLNCILTLTTPTNGFIASLYTIYARIDPSTFSDANAGNSQRVVGPLTVSTQHVDLEITSATNPYSGSVAPNQTATAQAIIGNFGSGISSGLVTINYYITTSTTLDDNAILIGTTNVLVSLGAAQVTTPIAVALTMTNVPQSSVYNLIAQITAASDVDNVPDDNVTTVIGTINYQGIM